MAVDFGDGNTANYYSVATSSNFNLPDAAFVMAFWTNVEDNTGTAYQYLISAGTGTVGTANTWNIYLGEASAAIAPGNWAFWAGDADGDNIAGQNNALQLQSTSGDFDDGEDRLIVIQRTATRFEMYSCRRGQDPVLEDYSDDLSSFNAATPVSTINVGRRTDGSSTRYFEERVGDFGFYTGGSLTEAQIKLLGQGSIDPSDLGLTAQVQYSLNTHTDTTDDSGNGNTLTENGTVGDAGFDFLYLVGAADIVSRTILQRDGSNEGTISLSGTYSGTAPNDIQARVIDARDGTTVVLDYTTLTSATIASNEWDGTLAGIPYGNDTGTAYMFLVQVRSRDAVPAVIDTAPLGVNQWGVGDIFAIHGSSSADKWESQGTGSPSDQTGVYYSDAWKAPAGTGGCAFANALVTGLGNPIGMVNSGVGGTEWTDWDGDADTHYSAAEADITAVGGSIAGVIIVGLGYNDAYNNNVTGNSYYSDEYALYAALIRAHVSDATLPIFLSTPQRGLVAAHNDDTQWDRIRQGWTTAVATSNTHGVAPSCDLTIGGDNVHLTDAAYATQGARAATAVLDVLGSGTYHLGPTVASITAISSTVTDVTITHDGGTDFTPTSAIVGFEVSNDDFATTKTISTAVRSDATTIRLTHAALTGARKVRYQYGADPYGGNTATGAVEDNTSEVLPLMFTTSALSAAALAASGIMTFAVFANARHTTQGDILQEGVLDIGGTSVQSDAITGSGNVRRVVRVLTDTACFLTWGEDPTALDDGSDGRPLPTESPECFSVQSGHKLAAIQRT